MTEPAEFLTMALGDGSHRVRLDRLTDGRIMCQLCFGHFAVADLNPVDGGVEDICKPCARTEFLRGTLAHVTHGTKYHTDANCPRMIHGEELHDCEGDDYGGWFSAGSYRAVSNIHDAAMRGKLPCLGCVPPELREMPGTEDFGHQPEWHYVGYCGGCEQCGDNEETEVCARCATVTTWHDGNGQLHVDRRAITWPCTSAIVLGLVERGEAAA